LWRCGSGSGSLRLGQGGECALKRVSQFRFGTVFGGGARAGGSGSHGSFRHRLGLFRQLGCRRTVFKMKRLLGVSLALCSFFASAALGADVRSDIKSSERDKRKVDQEIKEKRKELKVLNSKDQGLLNQIITYNRKVNRARNNERV